MLVGGSNGRFRLEAAEGAALAAQLANMMRTDGVGVAVTPSRRTAPAVMDALRTALEPLGGTVWDGAGENPYFGLLACADAIVVTADSVSMVSEAVATAVPVLAAQSRSALAQRLSGLPTDEQYDLLLDLVRSHMATVLGLPNPQAIAPDLAFQDHGFDSLTAVELRNRLKAATGLTLSPTLIFDYPNPSAIAEYFRTQLVGESEEAPAVNPVDEELQRVVASIPVKRLRQAGVLDMLLNLAAQGSGVDTAETAASAEPRSQDIADMDLQDLLAAFSDDDDG